MSVPVECFEREDESKQQPVKSLDDRNISTSSTEASLSSINLQRLRRQKDTL